MALKPIASAQAAVEQDDGAAVSAEIVSVGDLLSMELRVQSYQRTYSWSTKHTTALFWCGLLAHYDRFHNFDVWAVRKLFTWAVMIRVDIQSLGFDTINKYAIGDGADQYTNNMTGNLIWYRGSSESGTANLIC